MEAKNERDGMLDFPCDVERLPDGNTLIADAGNNEGEGSEILEVNPAGQVVWRYAAGLRFAHSAKRLPNGNTLITDTTNNRVLEVTRAGAVALDSDCWGNGTGRLSDGSHLHYPNDAHPLPDGTLLITDRNNDRCLIADRSGVVLWQYRGAKHPHNADMLPDGNVLLANSDDNSVLEVNRGGEVVWSYSGAEDPLDWPRDADRLDNGNTLIADSKNSRVIEVTPGGRVAWTFRLPYFANVYDADKLSNSNVLLSDQQHHQVLEVDTFGNVVWQFRNDRLPYEVSRSLLNGSFARRDARGMPAHWMAYVKTSEGGGLVVWDEAGGPAPCPGVQFDRAGAFSLYQVVGVKAGAVCRLDGEIRAEIESGAAVAFFQLAFLDAFGGLIEDVVKAPKGELLTSTAGWRKDSIEAKAPGRATAVEVHLRISGRGAAWMRNVSLATR